MLLGTMEHVGELIDEVVSCFPAVDFDDPREVAGIRRH